MENLKFELKLKELPIDITDVDGKEKKFTLKELSGKQRDEFLNDMGERMKFNADGESEGLKDYKGLQSGLLSLCLYDDGGKLVKKEALEEYPSSVLSSLFNAASELSGLDKGAEAKVKND